MKILISDYTFDATASTITFGRYSNIEKERLLVITNVTSNTIIFNFADPAKTGTVAANVLTLDTDTSSMGSSDNLQIWYWEEGLLTLIREHSTDPTISYVGKAVPGTATSSALWQIKRIIAAANDVTIEFAGSDDKFDNIFDDRESLTYG